jgi:hypothetical protein
MFALDDPAKLLSALAELQKECARGNAGAIPKSAVEQLFQV